MRINILLLALTCFLSACSTNQKSRLAATGIGIGVGGIIGASTAPSDERPELHAMYWGGIVGVVTAVAANYYFSDERDSQILRLENEKMKAQLDFFQNGPATLLETSKTNKADKKFFQDGKAVIKLYQVDRWVEDGPNKRYHQDQMMEILPVPKSNK